MQKFNPLRVLLLAYLQSVDNDGSIRYEAMININHVFSEIDTPYSPGAFYHEVKKLAAAGMINNHQERITIAQPGLSWLSEQMSSSPLPASITGKIYYLCAASLLRDSESKLQAIRRIEINMININHISDKISQDFGALMSATNSWISQLNLAIKRFTSDLSAQ